jgi:hypothetical protein
MKKEPHKTHVAIHVPAGGNGYSDEDLDVLKTIARDLKVPEERVISQFYNNLPSLGGGDVAGTIELIIDTRNS